MNFIRKWTKSEFIIHVGTLVGGTLFAQLITFAASPLLTRLYGPEQFGKMAIFVSVVMILSAVLNGKYDLGIPAISSRNEARLLVHTAFGVLAILSVLLIIVGLIAFMMIGNEKLLNLYPNYFLFFVILTAIGLSGSSICSAWNNWRKAYQQIAYSRVIQSIVAVTLGITLASVTELGLVLSYIAGIFAGFIFLYTTAKIKMAFYVKKRRQLIESAYKHIEFPKFILPGTLLNVLSQQIPVLMTAMLFSESLSGSYSLVVGVLSIPGALIGAAVGQVFFQKFSDWYHNNKDVKVLLKKVWLRLFLISIIPTIIIVFYGEEIFIFVFGDKWDEAGRIAEILAPMFLASFISSSTSTHYIVLGLMKMSFYWGIYTSIYRTLSFFVGWYLNDFVIGIKILVMFEITTLIIYNTYSWKKL